MSRAAGTLVITGASAGVGRATASEFARQGWKVALLARGTEGLEAAARDVRACGSEAMILPIDVASADAVFAAAGRVVGEWGRIDVWINCAMVTVYGLVREMTPAEYARVTEVTYLGYVHGTLAALRHMRPRDAGTIIQVGSALAYRAIPVQSAYCAAKFAVRGFTDSLRSELIEEGSRIRICMVQLPAVNTPQFDWARNHMPHRARPVAPVFQPEAVAREIFRAALRAPREVWVGRPTVQAIVANALAPGLLDRLFARVAIRGQQTDTPVQADAPDNLFAPGIHPATRGRFDDEARARVFSVAPSTLRFVYALLAGAVLLLVSSARRRRPALLHTKRVRSA